MQNCYLRLCFITSLWLFCATKLFAQNQVAVDSLNKLLANTLLRDTTRITILLELGNTYRNTQLDKALEISKKALALAEKRDKEPYIALCRNNIGIIEILRGDYEQASFHLQKGLMVGEKIADKTLISNTLNNLGTVYQHQSDYNRALQAYEQSMEIRKEIGNKIGVAACYNNMGMIYEKQGHYTKALEYFFESLKIKEAIDKPQTIANTLSNIGRVYNHLENEKSSLDYHFRALKIRQDINEKYGTAISFHEIGKVHQGLGDFVKAKTYYNQSLLIQHEIKYQQGLVDNYRQLGEIYFLQRKYDSSRRYLERAQKLAERIADKEGLAHALTKLSLLFAKTNKLSRAMFYAQHSLQMAHNMHSMSLMRDNYFVLYEIHKKLKENDKALHFYELGIAMQDSLLDEDKHLELYKLQTDYEIDRREAQILLMNKDNKIKEEELLLRTSQRNMLVGGAVVLLCFAFFLFYRFLEKQKANNILQQQKTQILERSEEILQQQEELSAQNESLITLNDQVSEQKVEIETMYSQLEHKIIERTEELEEAVEVLVKQNDDLEQFAYIVSHNLRSPIAQILGLTNLFRGEQNAENQELIEMLRNSAKNLDIVIKDLNHVLDIKTQHSKQYEEVNVIEVLKLTLKKFEQELQDKKVRVNMKVDETMPTIYAVKEYVENIIYQYLSNAIKFRNLRKTLVLEIELHQNFTHIVFLVADNGLGIYDTKKIFKLYQRQHLEIEGKGLNLFLVKTQMELLGGEVSVESIEGKGSIFTACFKIKS